MYKNFNISDEIYMVMIRENGEVYNKIIDGVVRYIGNSSMDITSMKNLENIVFCNGNLCGRDFNGNKYNIYLKKEDASFALNNLLDEQFLRQEVLKMIEQASVKQLQDIYSYIVAEKDRESCI